MKVREHVQISGGLLEDLKKRITTPELQPAEDAKCKMGTRGLLVEEAS